MITTPFPTGNPTALPGTIAASWDWWDRQFQTEGAALIALDEYEGFYLEVWSRPNDQWMWRGFYRGGFLGGGGEADTAGAVLDAARVWADRCIADRQAGIFADDFRWRRAKLLKALARNGIRVTTRAEVN